MQPLIDYLFQQSVTDNLPDLIAWRHSFFTQPPAPPKAVRRRCVECGMVRVHSDHCLHLCRPCGYIGLAGEPPHKSWGRKTPTGPINPAYLELLCKP